MSFDKIRSEEELYSVLASLASPEDVKAFLTDLCTYNEIEYMAQRVESARLLMQGATYQKVISEVNVSTATLSRVSKAIKHGSGGYRKIFSEYLKKNGAAVVGETEEDIIYSLRSLYESCGYSAFKMRKFEEYSLYMENRNFLSSDNILTFRDNRGRLLALKPDVTLSIIKNTKATADRSEKYYYHESVYRYDRRSGEYREINQMGLESIGASDVYSTAEVIRLALESLRTVSPEYTLCLSHMALVGGLLEYAGADTFDKKRELFSSIKRKNEHDFELSAEKYGISGEKRRLLLSIFDMRGSFDECISGAERLVVDEGTKKAYEEMLTIGKTADAAGFRDKIRLDFSVANDIDYYNGVVFRGFISGVPRSVLSGGRYDGLVSKFAPGIGAIGFAVYLDDLAYFRRPSEYDVDVLLLYREDSDPAEVLRRADEIRKGGESVRVERGIPEGLTYRRLENVDATGTDDAR